MTYPNNDLKIYWLDEDVDITITYPTSLSSTPVNYYLYKYSHTRKDYSTTPFFVGSAFILYKSTEITLNFNDIIQSEADTYEVYKTKGEALPLDVCNLYKLSITIDGTEYTQEFQVNLINRYPNDTISHNEFRSMLFSGMGCYNLLTGFNDDKTPELTVVPHIPYISSKNLDFSFAYYLNYHSVLTGNDDISDSNKRWYLEGEDCILEKSLTFPTKRDMGSFYWNLSSKDLYDSVVFEQPDDEIWYTTSNNRILYIDSTHQALNNMILNHTYSDGKGVIKLNNVYTSLPSGCFSGLHYLQTISLPNTITELEPYSFYGCTHLESIYMPKVEIIGSNCFGNCYNYVEIYLPETLLYMGGYVFNNSNISFIKCYAQNAPTITNQTLIGIIPSTSIYVYNINKYKSATSDDVTLQLQQILKKLNNEDADLSTNYWNYLTNWGTLNPDETYNKENSTGLSISGENPAIYIAGLTNDLIAYIDRCPAKYYLQWVDRYGGIQTQSFSGKSTMKEKFDTVNIENSRGYKRKVVTQDEFSWELNTKWLTDDEYKVYEGIFVSPLVKLYDVENDKMYEVLVSDTSYTEKTYRNQKTMFNLTINVTNNKKERFLN